jgi:hypothetical protein
MEFKVPVLICFSFIQVMIHRNVCRMAGICKVIDCGDPKTKPCKLLIVAQVCILTHVVSSVPSSRLQTMLVPLYYIVCRQGMTNVVAKHFRSAMQRLMS